MYFRVTNNDAKLCEDLESLTHNENHLDALVFRNLRLKMISYISLLVCRHSVRVKYKIRLYASDYGASRANIPAYFNPGDIFLHCHNTGMCK